MVLSALSVYQFNAHAAAASDNTDAASQVAQVEFDRSFLTPGSSQAVDLSRFEKGNPVLPGTYSVDLYVNGGWMGRTEVPFRPLPDAPANANAQACFDRKLLAQISVDLKKLTPDVAAKLESPDSCLPIGEIISEATSTFDFGDQRLDLSIQQVSLSRNARGYVSPELWDNGVNAGFLGYNANVYRYDNSGSNGQNGSQTQGYVGLNTGFNLGPWHFRHNGSYTWSSTGGQHYQDIATYVQRDLPAWASQLTLGEGYTTGELFSSTSFRGARLATDDRMLPDSLRGYAPTVRGIATSNAKVSISQNGVVIYQTTVAPGAFEINDLYPTGYGGDLNVSVTEADGSVHSFSVPYAAVPLSLRPGGNRYSITAGTVRTPGVSGNPAFAQGTWQHGFTNLFTGYTGFNAATGYGALMAGGAFNTPFGALGADYTQAITNLPGQRQMSGGSIRVSYAKNLPQTGSNFAIAAYRYSTGGYFDLNTATLARSQIASSQSLDTVLRQRNSEQLTFSQRLGDRGGQLALTASVVNYWNRSGSDINYSVGYNNSYRNISYGIQATRQRSANGSLDTLYYASVTIPLGKTHPATVSTNLTHDTGDSQTQLQTTLSGALGTDNDLSYGVTVNHASGGAGSATTGGSANVMYRSPYAQFSATAGAGTGYSQGSLGVSGAVVAHPGGVTLSQPLSETFGIIEAKNAEGARLNNASGAQVDSHGYAVVPYLTPYAMNTVELDPKGLSTDVELQETSEQVAPHAGSIAFLKFATVYGRSAVIEARQANGTPLPFGASVLDESSKEIGVVGQASRIFARGLQDKGNLTVKWGDDASSLCHIAYDLPVRQKDSTSDSYQQIEENCTAAPAAASAPSYKPNVTASSEAVR